MVDVVSSGVERMSERFAGVSPPATRGLLVMEEGGVGLGSGVLVTTLRLGVVSSDLLLVY